jgi:hypothetical protein
MPSTREQLRRMVAERTPPPRGFAWDSLMEALGQLEEAARGQPLDAGDVDVLVDLVTRRGRVPLSGAVPALHCMPPTEAVQYRALKALDVAGRLDCVRDELPRVEQDADSPALRELAKRLMGSLTGN